jgi:dinuclear metal center YbgI/SA1388 family protein
MPISLREIVAALDTELNTRAITDYPGAWNGLQVKNAPETVARVAVAVDACEAVLEQAVALGADLLIVHHGLFWSGVQMVDGAYFRKLKLLMEHGLAVYSSHLPLDMHATLGNNVLLAKALELGPSTAFTEPKGPLGVRLQASISREALLTRVRAAVGGSRVHLAPGGPENCCHIGVCTGGAGTDVSKMKASGIDTFITGEGPHHTYSLAEELGVNLIYAGHYATETFGVKALGAWLEEKYGLPWSFVDHPSGL